MTRAEGEFDPLANLQGCGDTTQYQGDVNDGYGDTLSTAEAAWQDGINNMLDIKVENL